MAFGSYNDRRSSGGSGGSLHVPPSLNRLSSGEYKYKLSGWPGGGKAAARDSGISMASMSMSPESSPRDSFFRNSLRDSGISMYSPRDSIFKNSLRDSGNFASSQAIPEEATWTQIRQQQEEEDLLLIEEVEEEEDEEDKQRLRERMRERDSGILSRSTSLSSQVPPTPSTLVGSGPTHSEQLADEATTLLLTGDWSTATPEDELPTIDYLINQGGALNATAHLPVAIAPPACATMEAEEDEATPGKGGIVTISPLRVALHNYTQSRTRLCQGNMDALIQKDTFLHLVKQGADFWTKHSCQNHHVQQQPSIPSISVSDNDSGVAHDCAAPTPPQRRRGSSVFEDLIDFTAQHYAGGPSFSLPLIKAMVENDPERRRLSCGDLTSAFERLAACGTLGSVDMPVGRYLLTLPGVRPDGYYLRQFQMLDDEYLSGQWRARGRRYTERQFREACDEF